MPYWQSRLRNSGRLQVKSNLRVLKNSEGEIGILGATNIDVHNIHSPAAFFRYTHQAQPTLVTLCKTTTCLQFFDEVSALQVLEVLCITRLLKYLTGLILLTPNFCCLQACGFFPQVVLCAVAGNVNVQVVNIKTVGRGLKIWRSCFQMLQIHISQMMCFPCSHSADDALSTSPMLANSYYKQTLATNPTSSDYYCPTIAARIVVASTIASGFRDNHWKSQCEGCEHKNCRQSLNPCTNVFLSAVTHILDITCFSCISHSVTNALKTPPMLAKQANPATNLTSSSSYLLFFNNLSTFLQNLNRGGSQTPLTHTNLESPKNQTD